MEKSKTITATPPIKAFIKTLSHEGRGITHQDGKIVFVEGALPGEEILFTYTRKKGAYNEGKLLEVLTPSPQRIIPRCVHFGVCGGCSLQHLSAKSQLEFKQNIFLEQLKHFGGIIPQTLLPPLTGPHWGYRYKARLGVKYVSKKQTVLVGFREKNGRFLAELSRCEVLHPKVGYNILALKTLINQLNAYKTIPQIEVALGDDGTTALIFRHMQPLVEEDQEKLRQFAKLYAMDIYLQPGDGQTVHPLEGTTPSPLTYHLVEEKLTIEFTPTDFTQINRAINTSMVKQALALLEPNFSDRILDLFCGLGNFTLALARHAQHLTGIEGNADLIERAKKNALSNHIYNTDFFISNLADKKISGAWMQQVYTKILLDPPRSGALEIIQQFTQWNSIQRIVYVSCNPATFARDAQALTQQGYLLEKAGIMDMFPHTQHVEAIGLFTRKNKRPLL